MKNIDYCFISGLHGDLIVPLLYEFFKSKKLSFLTITENFNDYLIWKRLSIPVEYIYDKNIKINNNIFFQIKNKILKKLSIENLIITEYAYYKAPKFILKRKALTLLEKLSGLLTKYNFKIILQRPGGEILRRIFYNLEGTRYVYKNITFGESYLNGYSVIYEGEFKKFVETKNLLKNKLPDINSLLIKSFTGKVIEYKCKILKPKRNKIKILLNLLKAKNFYIIYSYFSIKFRDEIVGRIRRFFLFPFYYKKNILNLKYFYYPLNVQAESELYVRNYFFSNQYKTLLKLKSLIPNHYKLIVKEHPGFSKSLSFFQILKLIFKGIIFVNPSLSSKKLIENAQGVIGISSTVLIESIVYNKPILILGNWSYGTIIKRRMEFDLEKIQLFLDNPKIFKVESKSFFKELVNNYLVEGSAYKDQKELFNYLENIIYLFRKEEL